MNTAVMWICGVMVLTAVLIALVRVERGPSMLDRIVSLDVVIAALIGTTALWSAAREREDLISLLTVMAIVGFVASVTLARFAASEPEDGDDAVAEHELQAVETAQWAQGLDDEEDER